MTTKTNHVKKPVQERDLPSKNMRFRVVDDPQAILGLRDNWIRLADMAVESNVFFEEFMMSPAIEHLMNDQDVSFGVVEAPKRANPDARQVLCALFPFVRHRGRKTIAIWTHDYVFAGMPLVRRDCCDLAIRTMLDWFAEQNLWGWCFPAIHVGGQFHRAFWSEVQRRQLPFWIQRQDLRAAFRPGADYESFRQRSISRSTRAEIQRCDNRISSQGTIESRQLEDSDNVEEWIDAFLELESRGWKGNRGTAMKSNSDHAEFFRSVVSAAFSKQRLAMLKLTLDGRPIAMNSAFLAKDGGYYFKIAYDEKYRKYSPGCLLELEFAKWLHQHSEVQWLDSCAKPNHPMIDRIWDGRRNIQTYWIGAPSIAGATTLSALASAYQVKDSMKRKRRKK